MLSLRRLKSVGEMFISKPDVRMFYVWNPKFRRDPPQPGVPYVSKYPPEPAQEEKPYRLDRWTDWRMKKDYLRRQCVIKNGRKRLMLETVHKSTILPIEIRELAEIEKEDHMPRDANEMRLARRCAITSRSRACVEPWRVSRFIFRHLVDYNKLGGVQRGIW